MLLILSEPGDTTVRMVLPKLKARGAEVVWWDPAQYPAAAHLTAGFAAGGTELRLVTGGEVVDLGGTTAVWNRRPGQPAAAPSVTAGDLRERVGSSRSGSWRASGICWTRGGCRPGIRCCAGRTTSWSTWRWPRSWASSCRPPWSPTIRPSWRPPTSGRAGG
ncbi:MvdC/MvdD family ATP grasp protein [Nonomuraea thailandensis]